MIIAIIVLVALFILLVARAVAGRMSERSFTYRFLLALDLFACAVIFGHTDMTISSRCGVALYKESIDIPSSIVLCWLGTLLNLLSANHCTLAIADDVARARNAINNLLGDR